MDTVEPALLHVQHARADMYWLDVVYWVPKELALSQRYQHAGSDTAQMETQSCPSPLIHFGDIALMSNTRVLQQVLSFSRTLAFLTIMHSLGRCARIAQFTTRTARSVLTQKEISTDLRLSLILAPPLRRASNGY